MKQNSAFYPRPINRRWKELTAQAQAEAARVEQPTITRTAVVSASTFKPEATPEPRPTMSQEPTIHAEPEPVKVTKPKRIEPDDVSGKA
jgi:hypothetical protein